MLRRSFPYRVTFYTAYKARSPREARWYVSLTAEGCAQSKTAYCSPDRFLGYSLNSPVLLQRQDMVRTARQIGNFCRDKRRSLLLHYVCFTTHPLPLQRLAHTNKRLATKAMSESNQHYVLLQHFCLLAATACRSRTELHRQGPCLQASLLVTSSLVFP